LSTPLLNPFKVDARTLPSDVITCVHPFMQFVDKDEIDFRKTF
jgi:hypothetical protein